MKYNALNELAKMDEYYPNSDLSFHFAKHREQIILLTNTVEKIWVLKKADDACLQILYEGIKNSWQVVYYYVVGEQINKMIGKIQGIESLLYFGITDKKWKVRFNTTVILKAIQNNEIKTDILHIALNDKSKKVREMAEDVSVNYMN